VATARDLAHLPKAHLHLHLEGGMRPGTLAELAGKYGMAVPVVSGFGSFPVFADMYLAACEVLRSPEDLQRLIDETLDDAVAAGATYIEPALFVPHHRERLALTSRCWRSRWMRWLRHRRGQVSRHR